MRALSAFLFVLLALGAAPARAQEFAFSPDRGEGFARLMAFAHDGRVAEDVVNMNVGIDRTTARIELITRSAARRTILLSPPGNPGRWKSRYFAIDLGPGGLPSDAERLAPLLDEAFDRDPFVVVWHGFNDTRPVPPPEPLGDAWRRAGFSGLYDALLILSLRPVGRSFIEVVMLLHVLGLAGCFVILARAPAGAARKSA